MSHTQGTGFAMQVLGLDCLEQRGSQSWQPIRGGQYFIAMQSDCIRWERCEDPTFSLEFWNRPDVEWDDGNVTLQSASRDDNAGDAISCLDMLESGHTTPLRPIVQGGYT